MGMAISAVLFDFDGVLVDTEWAIYQSWKRVFEGHGQHLPLDIYTRCIGSDFATWSPKTHLEELTGLAFDWHDLDARRQEEILKDLTHEGPMHGAAMFVEKIKAGMLPQAVVSSSSHRWVDGWLEKIELAGYFQTTVCRGDAPRIKPAPDLYLVACRLLGVDPRDACAVEDSATGATAALAAGLTTVIVPSEWTRASAFPSAALSAASLTDISFRLPPR